ncbi:hypothetical protein ROJ8625_00535 [Roseivivax jejudonensis]|uniref:N-acetyltransferase domain-containing protein n=1 Tax=Roseivivax jejudonensis TaxID=1529041 RepID=A0A1X6YBC1_9RHOB|nr:GNAT family N-acetyltransferase [Roseivivax jejudonensis]SLN16224.1 hypothetical protein ROJ8625_00535 [Roseivivax jejudonensis]
MTARRCITAPEGAAAARAAQVRAAVPVIETARLRLVAPRLDHLPLWTRLMVPDDAGLLGGPHTDEEAWEAFCVYTAGWLLHGHGAWAVEGRDDGAHLGFVHVGLEWGDAEPELGFMFAPEARGAGFATEAARAARDAGTALFGAEGLVSYVAATNAASARLAARLGARRDAAAEAAIGEPDLQVWRHRAEAPA